MPKVIFRGHVFAGVARLDYEYDGKIDWANPEFNVEASYHISIVASNIIVTCELNKFSFDFIGEIHRKALDLSSSIVALVSFSTGVGCTVVLEECDVLGIEDAHIEPDHRNVVLNSHQAELAKYCTVFDKEVLG